MLRSLALLPSAGVMLVSLLLGFVSPVMTHGTVIEAVLFSAFVAFTLLWIRGSGRLI